VYAYQLNEANKFYVEDIYYLYGAHDRFYSILFLLI